MLGSVLDTLSTIEKIKVNVIGLAAQVRICQTICTETGGTSAIKLRIIQSLNGLIPFRRMFRIIPPSSTITSSLQSVR